MSWLQRISIVVSILLLCAVWGAHCLAAEASEWEENAIPIAVNLDGARYTSRSIVQSWLESPVMPHRQALVRGLPPALPHHQQRAAETMEAQPAMMPVLGGPGKGGALAIPQPSAVVRPGRMDLWTRSENAPATRPYVLYSHTVRGPWQWMIDTRIAGRYAHTEYYDFNHSTGQRYGVTASARRTWDRLTLDLAMPLDVVRFTDELDEFDYYRLGMTATPRIKIMDEAADGVGFTIGGTAYYHRSALRTEALPDPDHFGLGMFWALQKTVGPYIFHHGVQLMRQWNLDDQTEITDQNYVDVLTLGCGVGTRIGEDWALDGSMLWEHTPDLPQWMDTHAARLRVGATYSPSQNWVTHLSLETDLFDEDAKTIELGLLQSWMF